MSEFEPKRRQLKPWLINHYTPERPTRPGATGASVSNAGGPGQDPHLLKMLLTATSSNNVNLLREAINHGVFINYLFEGDERELGVFQVTVLHICAQKGYAECAKILMDNHADPEITASWGQTALMHSVNSQKHNMVQLLIGYGARLDTKDYQGRCALTYAITNHDMESLRLLLEAGACLESGDHYGHTPLHIAARSPDPRPLAMIVAMRKDADLEKPDFAKRTPLQHAVLSGSGESIDLLVDLGVDMDTLDQVHNTPLTNAINMFLQQPENYSYIGKILHLIDRGCKVNKPCPLTGRTALHCIMARNTPYQLIEYLLANGGDANIKDKDNCTPLHLSLMSNNKAMTRKLIRENCKLDSRAVDIAVMKGMTDMARALIAGGADWDRRKYLTKVETSPLFMHDYPEMLSLLLYHLTRVNTLSELARTAIRRTCPTGLPTHIQDFGLPNSLQEFVLLTQEMEDEYYEPW